MDQACPPKPLVNFVQGRRHLLDHPLLWTLTHLESLGCHFDHVERSTYSGSTPQDSKDTDNAEGLARNLSPEWKVRCIRSILLDGGRKFACARQGSHFYFQGQPIHRPPFVAFHRHQSDLSSDGVGYIHYTSVNGVRRAHCRGVAQASRVPNRRQDLLSLATPEDWTVDPYFLFILLALAQHQQRVSPESKPQTYSSRLLVTNVLDQESILLCQAEITTDLLNALGNLKAAAMPLTWPAIHRKMIPYKPFDTFASRLMHELVVPSLWTHPKPSKDAKSFGTKRRHKTDEGSEACNIRRVLDT